MSKDLQKAKAGRTLSKNSPRVLARELNTRLAADFRKHGIAAIERVRNENPAEYLKIITRILPKDINVSIEHTFSDVLREAQDMIDERNQRTKEKIVEGEFEVVRDE